MMTISDPNDLLRAAGGAAALNTIKLEDITVEDINEA